MLCYAQELLRQPAVYGAIAASLWQLLTEQESTA
jgi:hypothetical protein